MALIDSILSIFRDGRAANKERRAEMSMYLRKIADCCAEFRQVLDDIQRRPAPSHFGDVDRLQRPVDRLAEYFYYLDSVFSGRVESELLDDVAVSMSRVMWVEFPIVRQIAHNQNAILDRVARAWRTFEPYDVLIQNPHRLGSTSNIVTRQIDTFGLFAELIDEERRMHADAHAERNPVFQDVDPLLPFRAVSPEPFENYLSHLSFLETRLVALADAIDAGHSR